MPYLAIDDSQQASDEASQGYQEVQLQAGDGDQESGAGQVPDDSAGGL